ncbi:heavy metal translocating P-type ATPase [Arthrobacter pityocampae]|uniref:Heavy metal translocating P-type ATPase n=1 Tax=Arthrobacter pityocampae TaxID=547334 RepID=A0A2S5IZG1_9MICC|nr:heavy metal translocating P-type ATPase [Arthrobacter pityocampae]PPB49945.1 heavy metal translocating P-type ATPase [Arthrobacter pityocampae]
MRRRTSLPRLPWLVVITCVVITATILLDAAGAGAAAQRLATAYSLAVAAVQAYGMLRDIRKGHWGVDLLALMAILATAATGEYYASIVVVLMIASGQALDDFASARAQTQLRALLERAPRAAHRVMEEERDQDGTDGAPAGGAIEDVPIDDLRVGDLVLVRPAEVVPADGTLTADSATLDESMLTGESLPVDYVRGAHILSGSLNGADALTLRATATPAHSQYSRIVALVAEASASRSPTVRLADRFAVPFTVFALALAALSWVLSSDPTRAAAVLVAATPCPLLIAAPVAFLGGISRAARAGIIVRSTQALEQLARARSVAFDKTGTLTSGTPLVGAIVLAPMAAPLTEDEVLGLTASAEQYSTHVLAAAIIAEAARRGLALHPASGAQEFATDGVRAEVAGTTVAVGKRRFVERLVGPVPDPPLSPGETAVYVGVGERFAGCILLRDALRGTAPSTIRSLVALGVREVLMLTGDVEATARPIAREAGVDTIHTDCLPGDKVEIVRNLPERPVIMVGDGVNDAPVLAAADVGIAMGARGSTAASESAEVVITVDDLAKVGEAVLIGKRTLRIALQSIGIGIGLSLVLMTGAALGLVPPLAGAFGQEGIDLLTILYALRAARAPRSGARGSTDAGRSAHG